MGDRYILIKDDLGTFLQKLSFDYRVYVPVKKGENRFFKEFPTNPRDIVMGEVRPFEPLKAFFFQAREVVAEGFKESIPHEGDKPFAIVGVKACDLKGFKVQDHVFKDHGCQDPFYIQRRESNLIISSDCTCAIETCFCLALGVKPHPVEDFDLNFSDIGEKFIVEVGSEKGRAVVNKISSLFTTVTPEEINHRDGERARVVKEVEENLKSHEIPRQEVFGGIIERNFKSGIWEDEAKTCVECGACNTICPTCHCFLLYDQTDAEKMERLRIWDSCLIKDFARVAGGANPRPKLWMRLRNRFEKKFDFFPKVASVYACTGCGRCVSACPAKIDIRKVLRRLVQNA
jgi:sulfhydrogenase subunit beta (sulfur reductase)